MTMLIGDVRQTLQTLPERSVHCVVTSPPYWSLRSYLDKSHADKHLEIGSEPTMAAHIETMVAVMREVRRVVDDLVEAYAEIERMRNTCAVCGCALHESDSVPHCQDEPADEEHEESWRAAMHTAHLMRDSALARAKQDETGDDA
jgi:hypothetical protein